ncbi:MAG TPA: hypothetical protein VFQ65_14155 [Kofleriaceae bacterium]|nr:hypothetical protein [Kofleriaceae bacterium]
MGAATSPLVALVALGAVVALARSARADECTGTSRRGDRFATCFDVGNRLSVDAGSDGLGVGIALRHRITFDDDPDLEWKMEHALVDANYSVLETRFTGTFYRGRYLRHARDGHVLIPIGGTPTKIFLPFDIGAIFEIGHLDWKQLEPTFTIGVLRVAPLVELARSKDYKRVLAIGPAMHWDMEVDRDFQMPTLHTIAPFSEGLASLRLESNDGLWVTEARFEAGSAWRSDRGWHREARTSATIERIVVSVNDRPIAITAGFEYDSARNETLAKIGARVAVLERTDPRVSLHPLQPRETAPPPPAPPPPIPEPVEPPFAPSELPSAGDAAEPQAGPMLDRDGALALIRAV